MKYRALSRRPANHQRLLSLQRDLLTHFKCVTYVCDKRFLLTLMFADYAIEPFYYERGVNFYENGQNYALASLLSIVGPIRRWSHWSSPRFRGVPPAVPHARPERRSVSRNSNTASAMAP